MYACVCVLYPSGFMYVCGLCLLDVYVCMLCFIYVCMAFMLVFSAPVCFLCLYDLYVRMMCYVCINCMVVFVYVRMVCMSVQRLCLCAFYVWFDVYVCTS